MADYKDYIVRYDIQASVQNAAIGLKELKAIVTQLEAPMTNISKAISQVSSSMQQLKQNSQITFAPKIDIAGFNNQLRKMVVDVRAAATEMHAALFEALAGNPKATSAMKNGLSKTLASPQSLAQIKREIESYERELDKLYGTRKKSKRGETIRNRDGSIFYAKKANMHERVAQLEGQGKAIRARISQLKADQAVLEKMEKDAAATTARTAATTKKAVAKAQAAPVTNVTPAVIRQWKQAFGDAKLKNLTVNIRGNASGPKGALTVIEQVMASLKTLQSQASFTINPVLHAEGFAAAEAKLRSLAALSGKVVAPFGGTTGKDGKAKSAASIPVNAKISSSSITESIKGMKRPTLPVAVKLMWDKGAIGRQEQLKGIQSKIPPIKLTLDSTQAIAKLEEFIALVKSSSPQNIALTATGSAGSGKTGAASAGKGGGTTGHQNSGSNKGKQPLTARERYEQMQSKSMAAYTKQKLDNRFRASKHAEYSSQQSAWRIQRQAMYDRLFERVPGPDYGWARRAEMQRAGELAQMRSDAMAAFAKPTPFEQKERAARQAAVSGSIARHQKQAEKLRARAQNAMLPYAQTKEQLNLLTKYRKFFRQAMATTGFSAQSMQPAQMLPYLQAVSAQMQSAGVAVPWQLQSQINKLQAQPQSSAPVPTRSHSYTPVPARQKPFFDRARKWAYPFTGQTSFGARTPMAVDMAKGMGVMFAIGGAMSAIGGSFGQAMEYQNTMRTTQAILQHGTDSYSQSEFRNMEGIVREVGVKTKFSAPEVASAARFLAMAGYDISGINAAIRPIADLALIGDSDLGETADKMTNILTTFGINADKLRTNPNIIRQYANIMATTATRSNTDLMMLAESAKYGGGVANLYGRNDPNLFADTMALFGVMGNAGIQASSAGTALRMMYQNIFKPNKNQKKVLDMMQSTYGISTLNADGSYRAMSSILTEMAQRIPENRMAEIVGNLFRITAQPGAAASLLAAAGGDQNAANEIGAGIDILSDKMSNKRGMSALVSLMLANRNSINGNISGSIAEEKQNTIAGLWAQVTSTFTEGIVQAFEQRQGGFEGMLRELRDYLAKPETVTMLQKLLDMVIEIGKVLAWVVSLWAEIYSTAPDLIKFWVKWQLIFTQLGSFIAPVVALIGVFNRLGGVIAWLTGVSSAGITTSAGRVAAGGAAATAANAAMYAPLVVGSGRKGRPVSIRGNFAARTRQQLANNAILAGELALSGADLASTRAPLDSSTRNHAMAVRNRAQRIYGAGPRIARAFRGGMSATLSVASLAPMFGGLGKLFTGLLAGMAKAVGLLFNPITLTIGAVAGLGYGLYKLKQRIDGTSDAQIESRKKANKAADQTLREQAKQGEWYKNFVNADIPTPATVVSSVDTEAIKQYDAEQQRFKSLYATVFNDFSKDASKQSVNDVATKWRKGIQFNTANRLGLGNKYYEYAGAGLTSWTNSNKQLPYNTYSGYNDSSNAGVALYNLLVADEDHAIDLQKRMVQGAFMMEGANSPIAQSAIQEITKYRRQLSQKEITGEKYRTLVNDVINRVRGGFTTTLPATGMTPAQFQQTSDRSVYAPYQQGVMNIIQSYINGDMGTMTGQIAAYEQLANGSVQQYTTEWYNAIAHIIGNYHVIYQAVSRDGNQTADIELMLQSLPNGRIDFSNILEQIRSKIANFKITLQNFTDILASAYKMMAEAGIIDINSRDDLKKLIRNQMAGATYGEDTYRDYFKTHVSKSAEWAGINEQTYVDFMMGRSGETIQTKKRIVNRNAEKQQMYWNFAGASADKVMGDIQASQKKAKALGGGKNIPGTQNPPPSAPTNPGTQDAYASHYDKSAARPTVVNINIGELAHFDRTAIASSSQERDIMAAMEEKIAESIYRLSMAAFNNTGGYA